MIEMSGDDARIALGMWNMVDDEHAGLFMSAITTAIESAIAGDCAGCSCDVCISLRGTMIGVQSYLAPPG